MRTFSRTLSRTALMLFVCITALTSVRCKDSCTGQPPPLSLTAHVRFIHAITDAPAVDFLFDSTTIVSGATFNTYDSATCCYRDCRTVGSGTFTARLSGSSATLVSAPGTLDDGAYYTVVMLNTRATPQLLILRDTLDTPAPDSARVRVIHAVPDLPAMDVRLGNQVIARNVRFGTSSGYVRIHNLLPKPFGADTGGFSAYPVGNPAQEIVGLPSGHVIIPGQNVLTLIVLGKASPNGNEPLAALSVFQDNFASVHGKGDVILQSEFAALRLLNASAYADSTVLEIFNAVSSGYPPDWRRDFPEQERVYGILQDSMSGYLFVGFSGFDKDSQGLYRAAVRVTKSFSDNFFSDSVMIDPFLKDHRYTCALLGNAPRYNLVVLHDTTPNPPSGQAAVRFLDGVDEPGQTLSLKVNGAAAVFTGVTYKSVTTSVPVAAGPATFTLVPSIGSPVSITATLKPDETYTVVGAGTSAAGTLRVRVFEK